MSFEKDLAIKLATLSEKVYGTLTFSVENHGFLVEDNIDGKQIVAFPGSYEIMDWIENTNFIKVHRDGLGDLHNGFADAWDILRKPLIKTLDMSREVYLTGHSLGGALACIAALALHNIGFKIAAVYTFGSPRVGDWDWKKNFEKSKIIHYRVVNGKDMVANSPKLLYFHVGKEIHINRKGFFSWLHEKGTDHFLGNYLENLRKLG